MEINHTNADNQLTSDAIAKIKARLTKDWFLILKTISDTPGIQHKALCEKINKTPSNLSNMIEKINKIDLPLILTVPNGTKKCYSLTDVAAQYVEQELLSEKQSAKSREFFHSKSTETIITKAKKTINLLKENCNHDLHNIVSSLLNEEKNVTVNAEIEKLYHDLLNILCDFRKQDIDIKQILDILEDESLSDQLIVYLDNKFVYFDFFKPLLTSGRMDNTTRFQIIDNVFSELHPSIFSPYQDMELSETLLTPIEWNNLLLGIVKLSKEFIDRNYSKSTAVANWETYLLNSDLAFYIAEKCSVLMFLCRLVSVPSDKSN